MSKILTKENFEQYIELIKNQKPKRPVFYCPIYNDCAKQQEKGLPSLCSLKCKNIKSFKTIKELKNNNQ